MALRLGFESFDIYEEGIRVGFILYDTILPQRMIEVIDMDTYHILNEYENTLIYMSLIEIEDDHRGLGYGERALKEFISLMKSNDKSLIVLTALPESPENQERIEKFYIRMGFKMIWRSKKDETNVMILEL